MSVQNRTLSVSKFSPDSLEPSKHHVRSSDTDVSDQFVRSVREVGIIQFPVAWIEDNQVRVLDGMRRVKAAQKAGKTEIPVLICETDESDAAALALSSNLMVWRKSVTDNDRESTLRFLIGGPRKPLNEWEQSNEVNDARYRLGLDSDVDVLERAMQDISGVGRKTAEALVETIGDADKIREAPAEELEQVPGVGPQKAKRITDWFSG